MKVKSESEVTQLHLTLSDPMDCSPPGSSVHGFSKQEYWSGLPFPSPEDLPNPRIKLGSPELQVAWEMAINLLFFYSPLK